MATLVPCRSSVVTRLGLWALPVIGACSWADAPTPADHAAPDTLLAIPLTVIGAFDGEDYDVFGDVASVAADVAGVIYVADRHGSTVRAYSTTGEYLGLVGSEGEGLGEFTRPGDVTLDPLGRLYVRDLTRISVFEPRGASAVADSLVRTTSLGRFHPEASRGVATASVYFMPSYFYRMFRFERYFYEAYDSLGATGDTLPVPAMEGMERLGRAVYMIEEGTGRPVPGLAHAPFEAVPKWTLTPTGSVLWTTGVDYRIASTESGVSDATFIARDASQRPVPEAWARDSASALRARLDSIPAPLDEVRGMSPMARAGAVPEVLPAILDLLVAADGTIWVRRYPPESAEGDSFFDVFGDDGELLATVRVPTMLSTMVSPFVSDSLIVGVVTEPGTGVDQVAVFAVPGLSSR